MSPEALVVQAKLTFESDLALMAAPVFHLLHASQSRLVVIPGMEKRPTPNKKRPSATANDNDVAGSTSLNPLRAFLAGQKENITHLRRFFHKQDTNEIFARSLMIMMAAQQDKIFAHILSSADLSVVNEALLLPEEMFKVLHPHLLAFCAAMARTHQIAQIDEPIEKIVAQKPQEVLKPARQPVSRFLRRGSKKKKVTVGSNAEVDVFEEKEGASSEVVGGTAAETGNNEGTNDSTACAFNTEQLEMRSDFEAAARSLYEMSTVVATANLETTSTSSQIASMKKWRRRNSKGSEKPAHGADSIVAGQTHQLKDIGSIYLLSLGHMCTLYAGLKFKEVSQLLPTGKMNGTSQDMQGALQLALAAAEHTQPELFCPRLGQFLQPRSNDGDDNDEEDDIDNFEESDIDVGESAGNEDDNENGVDSNAEKSDEEGNNAAEIEEEEEEEEEKEETIEDEQDQNDTSRSQSWRHQRRLQQRNKRRGEIMILNAASLFH
jgi:hypothetical protein